MADEFWEHAAQHDPLWAILSDPTKRDRGWDLATFFEHGRREIALLLQRLRDLRHVPRSARALDFGCGVGRLTQALAGTFDEVIGVDASPTMIRLAEQLNKHGSKVRYLLNQGPTLDTVASHSIDLLYSDIVLQHLEPPLAMRYIAEFVRVIAPGGLAVFQLPSRKRTPREMPERPIVMPSTAYQAELQLLEPPPPSMAAGTTAVVRLSVRNVSGLTWNQSLIRLGNHWRNSTGEMVVQDDGRVTVLGDLTEPAELALTVKAPQSEGAYTCEFDLVHEGVTWFGDRGSPIVRVPIVVPSSAGDVETSIRPTDNPPIETFPDIHALLPPPTERGIGAFPMFGVSRLAVEELVRSLGAELLQVDDDERAGPEWESYIYFVRKRAMKSRH